MSLPRTQSWSQPESLPRSDNLQDNDLILYTLCFGPNKTHSQGECPCIPVQVKANRHSPPMREALWGPSPQTLSRGTPSRNQRGPGCVGAGWRRGPQHRGLRREAPATVETRCPLSRKGGGPLPLSPPLLTGWLFGPRLPQEEAWWALNSSLRTRGHKHKCGLGSGR